MLRWDEAAPNGAVSAHKVPLIVDGRTAEEKIISKSRSRRYNECSTEQAPKHGASAGFSAPSKQVLLID